MCSHFESVTKKEVIKQYFDAEVTAEDAKADIWPGYKGLLIWASPVSPDTRT